MILTLVCWLLGALGTWALIRVGAQADRRLEEFYKERRRTW